MFETIAAGWAELEAALFALVSSVWALPALFVATAGDGFFPPVPGETVIIMLAVGAQTGGGPGLGWVVLVAALGAWCGDQLAFSLGRAVGASRMPFLRGARGRRAVAWAVRSFERRGASVVLGARFVPVGRMAVNVTAGTVGFSRRRFMVLSAAASVAWSLWSVLLGVLAADQLGDRPLLAVAVGVAVGTVVGLVVDRAVSVWGARRRRRAAPAAPDRGPLPGPALAGVVHPGGSDLRVCDLSAPGGRSRPR
ncbi:VTT domain-containing protein [Isoptericola sp. NEAU-Y5]|uniref:VTT domain-containing protein n=1 Tax=Isoptericola luteus TaxID=2879484 RepID=A0ABS7ZBK9_9MICO|nr:VTT domain-containing protein [Isoptericola sp. NEAU-Y5]MCA5892435.1 VTT domain-containing protein [Isoptericola sp. NEAU-Y5]